MLNDERHACNAFLANFEIEDVPAKTLLKATVDEAAKKELTQKAIANSLRSCLKEFI